MRSIGICLAACKQFQFSHILQLGMDYFLEMQEAQGMFISTFMLLVIINLSLSQVVTIQALLIATGVL